MMNASWTETMDYCDGVGGYLVRIETMEEKRSRNIFTNSGEHCGQMKKRWYSPTGFQANPATPVAWSTLWKCVAKVNGMMLLN